MANVWWQRAKAYYLLTKPKTVGLLVFVGMASALIIFPSWPKNLLKLVSCFLALLLSVAGTNAVTCWIDKDIDKLMRRTSNRPLPRGELTPRAALLFGLTTFFLGCLISLYLKPEATVYLVLGFIFSAVVYNGYLKRRSPLNIFFASPAGMMPIFFSWSFLGEKISLVTFLLGLLVVFWTPAHIWSLAILYAADYSKAKVPMLPLVAGKKETIKLIGIFNATMIAVSLSLGWSGFFGKLYLFVALAINAGALFFTALVYFNPQQENLWRLFKFSSPYLSLLFLAMVIDRFFGF